MITRPEKIYEWCIPDDNLLLTMKIRRQVSTGHVIHLLVGFFGFLAFDVLHFSEMSGALHFKKTSFTALFAIFHCY